MERNSSEEEAPRKMGRDEREVTDMWKKESVC